jgi:hypothetical protein
MLHVSRIDLSENMLHQLEFNEGVDLVDHCSKTFLATSDNS